MEYYLAERMYNIYYLLRKGRGTDQLVEALVRFMTSYYSPSELKDLRERISGEETTADAAMRPILRAVLELLPLPTHPTGGTANLKVSLSGGPADLTRQLTFTEHSEASPAPRNAPATLAWQAGDLVARAQQLLEDARYDQAIKVCDEIEAQPCEGGSSKAAEHVANALVAKSVSLGRLNRPNDAIAVCNEILNRYSANDSPDIVKTVATAQANKAALLGRLDRNEEVLAACEAFADRFDSSDSPATAEQRAHVLYNKGVALAKLGRSKKAGAVFDAVISRFESNDSVAVQETVARALLSKGSLLNEQYRLEDACNAYNAVVNRFGSSDSPKVVEVVATAMLCKGGSLRDLNRFEEALAIYNTVASRFGSHDSPEIAAMAQLNKGIMLDLLNRPEDARAAYDAMIDRFGSQDSPEIAEKVATALVNKGNSLARSHQAREALATYDAAVERFESTDSPKVAEAVATAMMHKGCLLRDLKRFEEALAIFNTVARRCESYDSPKITELVAMAQLNGGTMLDILNRPEDARAAYDAMIDRFGSQDSPEIAEKVATALVNKGNSLARSHQAEEALSAYDAAVERYSGSQSQIVVEMVRRALLGRAASELTLGRREAAIATAGRTLERVDANPSEIRITGHLLRAEAYFESGDQFACEIELAAMLKILPSLASLPAMSINALIAFTIRLGPKRVLKLIEESPSASHLYPLVTALRQELGIESKVAKEVEEVAKDIRRDLDSLRKPDGAANWVNTQSRPEPQWRATAHGAPAAFQQTEKPSSMSEFTATQIPKPSDEQAFERCNEILWRYILMDKTVQLYGRKGQKQYGVDLTGTRDGAPDRIVGVQCKLKGDGKKLTADEVRKEVAEALRFRPPLSEYIIVTTAPDDANLHNLAHELSISASKDRGMDLKVRVLGWGSLEREIRRYPRALQAFDPSHTPYGDLLEQKMDALPSNIAAALTPQLKTILDVVRGTQAINPAVSDKKAHSALEGQINDYVELVSTDPKTALKLLEKFQANLENDATDRIRFRVAANIAACQFNLGEEETAAQGFIAAYDLDPNNPKAIAHKALGLFIQDAWAALKVFAETQLSEFPDNAMLAACYIQGSVADGAVTDPLAHVPEAVRGAPEVAKAHVHWLMDRGGHGAWWDAAIAAHDAHPDNDALNEIYAGALLDRVLGRAGFLYGLVLSKDEHSDVETAISIYEARWPRIRDGHHARGESVSVPLNLMVAYRLKGQGYKAIEIGTEALKRFPGNAKVKGAAAAALIEQGEVDRTISLVSELEPNPETVMVRFNVAMATEDWGVVSDLFDTHGETFPEADRGFARAARVLADVEQAPLERRRSILEAEQDKFQGDTRALIVLAQSARKHGLNDLASTYFTAGQSAFERGDDGFACRVAVAYEAMQRGEPRTTADMLTGHLPLDHDSPELRLLAQVLAHDVPIRDRAVRFFEDLPSEVRSLPIFQSFEGALHFNRGVPQDAVGPFTAAFEREPCIDNLMGLIGAYSGVRDRDAITALLQHNGIDTLPGSSLARIDFCRVLLDFGEGTRAFELGYQALIDGLEHADVVMKFFGLVLKPTPHRPDNFDGVVAPGVWVRLTSSLGEAYEALVGEAADRPWGEKAALSNAFVAKALGLTTGDVFEHVNAVGVTETWTVAEVKPCWLQAFHHLSKNFGQRFPDAKSFASVPMAEGDIEPVLGHVRRHSEALRLRANLYLVDKLPIAFVAGDRPGGSIAFAEYLISIGEGVRVCYGTADERAEALTLIEDNGRSGAVLDALTAWCAAGFGVFPVLEARLGPLAIPANELGRLQAMLDDPVGEADKETMSLTYQDGQYTRRIMTPEDRAGQMELIKSRLAAIEEACAVEPVVIPDDLSELGEMLLGHPSGDAIAPAVIAGQDRLLLCEDMMMRQLTVLAFGAKAVWLQAVLLSALQAGTMTLKDYSDALVQLAAHHHDDVSISTPVLFSVFERDTSSELLQLQALCGYIGTKTAEPVSHIRLAADFINAIWADSSAHDLKVQTATNLVLCALLVRNRGEEWARWAGSLILKLNMAPRTYFTSWCQQHSLPIDDIDEVLRQARNSTTKGTDQIRAEIHAKGRAS